MPLYRVSRQHPAVPKLLQSSDGCDIYAEATGDPRNAHVVLLHGMTLSAAVFDDFCRLPSILDALYIVRYDMRGHGRSGQPDTPEGHASQLYADDFMTVVRAFDLHDPVLVGWSIGGVIYADLCNALTAPPISGVFYMHAPTSIPHLFSSVATPALLDIIAQCADLTTQSAGMLGLAAGCFATPREKRVPFQLHSMYAGMGALQSRATRMCWLSRSQKTTRLWDAAQAGLPMFVLYSTHDTLVDGRAVEKEVREHAVDVEVCCLQNCGHTPFWEVPEETARLLVGFVRRVWKRKDMKS